MEQAVGHSVEKGKSSTRGLYTSFGSILNVRIRIDVFIELLQPVPYEPKEHPLLSPSLVTS